MSVSQYTMLHFDQDWSFRCECLEVMKNLFQKMGPFDLVQGRGTHGLLAVLKALSHLLNRNTNPAPPSRQELSEAVDKTSWNKPQKKLVVLGLNTSRQSPQASISDLVAQMSLQRHDSILGATLFAAHMNLLFGETFE